ncbi:VOC family protein [Streptomyces phaeochromogenes]|uniref:VOC family protein n=1 Tax=Streptomyces phaeochromogenes TaxID=1923 RepID=UPI002DDBEFE1|nr:VOC family protein [Streptomyces phaeochromogenes]WRZ34489.1 VOC family protein [Streptomyces phaeochromogenes]
MQIRSLGYLDFESPHFKEWETFGPEIFGLGLGEPGADGTVRLRMDDRHQRISVHPGDEERLAYVGWELKDKAAFRAAVKELEDKGFSPRLGTPEETADRQVQGLARFQDPYDFVHEIFYGATFTSGSFLPGKPMTGKFVAGLDGVGHVVFVVPEITPELEEFVTDVLGMELFGDWVATTADGRQTGPQFYRCNPRTHALGFVAVPGMRGVQHIAIESDHLDDVGRAYDLVQERELPITMTLGRHMTDNLVSFYMRSPTGFDIEFGAGGTLLDESFVQANPSNSEAWGHKFVAKSWAPTVKPLAD